MQSSAGASTSPAKRARISNIMAESNSEPAKPSKNINDVLPFELLSSIVQLCKPGVTAHEAYNTSTTRNPPLLFLFVCKHWNDVAKATASLWTNLSAPRYKIKMSPEKVRDMCKQLSNWLSYSRALPLHLGLVQPGRLYNIDPVTGEDIQEDLNDDELEYTQLAAAEQAKVILEVFSAFERRWRTMSIIFDDLFIRDFHPYLRQSLEAADRGKPVMGADLHHLNIKFGEDIEPKLESLAISAQACILDHVDAFPFKKVKFIENRPYYLDFKKDLKFICRCTSATKLRLRATQEGNDWFQAIQSLRVAGGQSFELRKALDPLPNLTFLELVNVTQTLDYLRCLNLPGLQYLAIETDEEDVPEICEVLEDFIRKSRCPLATLHAYTKHVHEAVLRIEGIMRKAMEEKTLVPSFALWGSWKASDEDNPLYQASGSREYWYGRQSFRDEPHLFLEHENGKIIPNKSNMDVVMARRTTQSNA